MNFHGIFHELSMGFFILEDFWRRFFFFLTFSTEQNPSNFNQNQYSDT